MKLSPTDVAHIRESYGRLMPGISQLSASFYEDLFRRNPKVRRLFADGIDAQGMRFMAAIGMVVDRLDDPDGLALLIDQLVDRHADMVITPDAANAMEEALVTTFRHALMPSFSAATETAWQRAIHYICNRIARASEMPDRQATAC